MAPLPHLDACRYSMVTSPPLGNVPNHRARRRAGSPGPWPWAPRMRGLPRAEGRIASAGSSGARVDVTTSAAHDRWSGTQNRCRQLRDPRVETSRTARTASASSRRPASRCCGPVDGKPRRGAGGVPRTRRDRVDIMMPGVDGLTVLAGLSGSVRPGTSPVSGGSVRRSRRTGSGVRGGRGRLRQPTIRPERPPQLLEDVQGRGRPDDRATAWRLRRCARSGSKRTER